MRAARPSRPGISADVVVAAKRRARRELSTRSRAVTASDFEFFALQTPRVRVARAHVIPLRRPLPPGSPAPVPPSPPRCKPALPLGATGLAGGVAAGVVTLVVVPDDPGPEPIPTPSFLRAVCEQLDRFRLVTTEVHIVFAIRRLHRPRQGAGAWLHAQPLQAL